jgi:hypothetical protein
MDNETSEEKRFDISEKGEIVLYEPDSSIQLEVRIEDETVWLTQAQMSVLFGTTRNNITLNIGNIFKEGELQKNAVCKDFLHTAADGKNTIHTEQIAFFVRTTLPPVQGVFCDGQIFDAYTFAADLIRTAKKRIILIDNYVDDSVLKMLTKRANGVSTIIITRRISDALAVDIERHNQQYPPIDVRTSGRFHDRFLILDDTVYHLGASPKDLGKKLFAFSRMEVDAEWLMEVGG